MDIISSLTEPSCANFTLALEFKDAGRESVKMKKRVVVNPDCTL